MRKPKPEQWFPNVEELYKQRFQYLVLVASKHIYNRDYAVDAVHDALAKSVKYFNEHPDRKVRETIVCHLVIKACKRLNRYSREIPAGLMGPIEEVSSLD